MTRITTLLLTAALGLTMNALSAHGAEIAKSTPIPSLPAIITKPGNYYFVANMYYAITFEPGPISPVSITVNAPGPVTIDMRGFTLSGPGQQFLNGWYTNPIGIVIESSNVTILNGSITGYLSGILASGYTYPNPVNYLSGIDLENITFKNGAEFGCVGFSYVNNSVVRNCDFSQQTDYGDPALSDSLSQTGNNYINDKVNNDNSFSISHGFENGLAAPVKVDYILNIHYSVTPANLTP
jgi:hypothetical protein